MKQLIKSLCTVALLLCSITASAQDFSVDGIYYNRTSDSTVAVARSPKGYRGDVSIPSTAAYESKTYLVTSIGDTAFYKCSNLSSVSIPENVDSIGMGAFHSCSSLSSITIPEGVTSIGELTFCYCNTLSSITIPESVTSIGDYAFYGCSSLSSVSIPENVDSIGMSAFHSCSSLSSITIPESVTSIGDYAFSRCSSLSSITIPEGVTSIGEWTFYGCSSLSSITIPESVTSIGELAFYGCSSLSSITIPESVTSIGDYAFYYCHSLSSVTIPEGVTSIGELTFSRCSSLSSVTIPEGVTSIGRSAFHSCSSLSSVTIPESVTSIGYYAFDGCSSLVKVINYSNLPISKGSSSYGNVGYYAAIVLDGNSLTTLGDFQFFTSEGKHYLANYIGNDNNLLLPNNYNGDSYSINEYAISKSKLSSVIIPEGVTTIEENAFQGVENLQSLTIGSGVVSIEEEAFASTPIKTIWLTNTPPSGYKNAKGLINYVANDQYTEFNHIEVYPYLSSVFEKDGIKYVPVSPSERTCHAIDCIYDSITSVVNINESVIFKGVEMRISKVMPYTFYGNSHIKEASLSHFGDIGDFAFYNCDNLKNIQVNNHGDIGNQAFYGCNNLEEVQVNNHGNIGNQAFSNCDNLTSAFIYNQGRIGNQAFYSCDSLKTVLLGDSINYLGSEAFYGCISLLEINIPNTVQTIGESCFYGCTTLMNTTIGKSVASIGPSAFENCSVLPKITLPKTVIRIGNSVFKGCTKLADVIIEDRTTVLKLGSNESSPLFADCPLDSVYIGGKISYSTSSDNGYSPFYRNTSLRTVVIANSEDQIYDNEFYGCTNLKNVSIGNGVKSIGNYAFSGCNSLDRFSFGSNMESIGTEAFSDCTNLTSITSHAATPPICGEQALDDINKWNCVLRVPSGYADAYQQAEQWKEFFFIEDVVALEHYILTYLVDGDIYYRDTLVHNEAIVLPEAPTKEGHTFNVWDGLPETMPAQDLTIHASFTVNTYKVYYYVGEELVHTAEVAYGDTIPEYIYEPSAEGEVFKGWEGETYETMPAHDVTYKANIINGINSVLLDPSSLIIYDLQGRKITNTENLQNGIYIINDQKVLIQK